MPGYCGISPIGNVSSTSAPPPVTYTWFSSLTFREFAERSYQLPDRFLPNRYADIAHGLGVATEYPMIHYIQDWDAYGYDGVIEDGVVLCLEVYVSEPGGHEGIIRSRA